MMFTTTGHLCNISIHAPREGGDVRHINLIKGTKTFQSTPPARGATTNYDSKAKAENISIHAPREGGDQAYQPDKGNRNISIHAPREGGDDFIWLHCLLLLAFQSTPPARGATTII